MPVHASYFASPIHPDLGDGFADIVEPARFPMHELRWRNQRAAETVGLHTLTDEEWVDALGRFVPLPGNLPAPRALRYHGHQFQQYNPDLGDGRGFLYAQLRECASKRILDLGTKGSGTTPWSRGGDGRLTLQGGVREVLAAELLEARGVPTCRLLSLIETGEPLQRHDETSPTRSCVMVRLQHSHMRYGTAQRLAWHDDKPRLRLLIDHLVQHYHTDIAGAADVPTALLARVQDAAVDTLAGWMSAGFVHGVLNTDNMNLTGESFDYGPWRFAVDLDPGFTAAYFDHSGLYAYGRQPAAVRWNLGQLARALSLVGDARALSSVLQDFDARYNARLAARMRARLGVRASDNDDADVGVILRVLRESRLPFDRFVFDWWGGAASEARAMAGPLAPLYRRRWFRPALDVLLRREAVRPDALDHAAFQVERPISLDIDTVRALWAHIDRNDDWKPFQEMVAAIRREGEAMAVANLLETGGGPA